MIENTKENLAQIIETVLHVKPGTFLVLKPADDEENMGHAEIVNEKPTIQKIRAAISTPEKECKLCDFIRLRLPGVGLAMCRIVMALDDTGMLADLPKNALAHHVVREIKGHSHDIHGTAVVFNDSDLGPVQ